MKVRELVLPTGTLSPEWIRAQYEAEQQEAANLQASLTDDKRKKIEARITAMSSNLAGLDLMGKEMKSPMLREMLYESRCRSLANVYVLSQGESAEIYSDVGVPGYALGERGVPAETEIRSSYNRIDTRLFAAKPFTRWNHKSMVKFDLLNTMQQRLKASLMLQEAGAWYRLVNYASGLTTGQGTTLGLEGTSAASQNAPAAVDSGTDKLTLSQLSQAKAGFGARLNDAAKIWINPTRVADLENFNQSTLGASPSALGYFAPNTQDLLLKKGFQGTMLGLDVVTDIVVPSIDAASTAGFMLGTPDYVGVIVIRTDLKIETFKDVKQLSDMFAGWMDVGFFIRWLKALQRLKVTVS